VAKKHEGGTARKPKILHVILDLNYGGMQKVVVRLVNATHQALENRVAVMSMGRDLVEELPDGVLVPFVQPRSRLSMLWPVRLAAVIRSEAPDIVHTHSGTWYKVAKAARQAGVRHVVYTDHGRPYPESPVAVQFDRRASRRTGAVVAVSEQLEERLRQLVAYPDRVTTILNGIDTGKFTPKIVDSFEGETVIGSVGRLDQVKGFDVLIEAFARVRADSVRPVRLIIAGDGPCRDELERQIIARGLQEAVELIGWCSDVPSFLQTLDIYCQSSFSEGTPLSVLEAMSCGVCPVVTSVGGNPFVLGEPLAHRLVPPRDESSLARALVDAVQDSDRRLLDGVVARNRVVETFGVGQMARAYEALYASLIQNGCY